MRFRDFQQDVFDTRSFYYFIFFDVMSLLYFVSEVWRPLLWARFKSGCSAHVSVGFPMRNTTTSDADWWCYIYMLLDVSLSVSIQFNHFLTRVEKSRLQGQKAEALSPSQNLGKSRESVVRAVGKEVRSSQISDNQKHEAHLKHCCMVRIWTNTWSNRIDIGVTMNILL